MVSATNTRVAPTIEAKRRGRARTRSTPLAARTAATKAHTNRRRPFIDSSTIGIREITALAIGDEKAKNAATRKSIVQNGRRHSAIAAKSARANAATPTYCVAASAKLAAGSG